MGKTPVAAQSRKVAVETLIRAPGCNARASSNVHKDLRLPTPR